MAHAAPPRIVIEHHGSPPPPPPYPPNDRGGDDAETTLARLVRTLKFITQWADRAERPVDQRKAFMARIGMSIPDSDDAYKSDTPNCDDVTGTGGTVAVTRSRHKKRQFTFNPSGIWLYRWLAVVSLTVVFNTYAIILRTTFTEINESVLWLWMTLDYVADAIYLIDILVQFRTSMFKENIIKFCCIELHSC